MLQDIFPAAMTDVLTALPASLACSVLADWLELRCVAHLDAAMMSKTAREPFLELLRTTVFPSARRVRTEREISYEHANLYDSFITWLVTRSVRVMALDVIDVDTSLLKTVLTHTGHCLKSVQLTAQEMKVVAATCSNLQRVQYLNGDIDAASLHRFLSNNQSIQHIEFPELFVAPWQEDQHYYITKCPELRVLLVSLQRGSYESFVAPFLLSLLAESPKLHTLTLKCGLDDQSISQLLPKCAHLRSLSLHDAKFDDATLLAIVTLCPHIIFLDLTSARNITDSGVTNAAKFLSLQNICLDEIRQLTVCSLNALSENSSATLTALSVVDAFLYNTDESLLRQSMCTIMTSCKKLTTLCANGKYLCRSHLHTLTKLRVRNFYTTNDHFAVIAKYCNAVQYLCVEDYGNDFCSGDANFRKLLNNCSKLHTLVVSGKLLYKVVKRTIRKEYSGRIPTIRLSKNIEDMKLSVLDMPIE